MIGDSRGRTRVVPLSLLVLVALSGGVILEAELNYANFVRSPGSSAQVTGVEELPEGLSFTVDVENNLRQPVRIEYVRLEITDGETTQSVSIPYGGHTSVPPDGGTVEAFVAERRYDQLSPLGDSLTVTGYLVVTVYNGHQFTIQITDSEVTP